MRVDPIFGRKRLHPGATVLAPFSGRHSGHAFRPEHIEPRFPSPMYYYTYFNMLCRLATVSLTSQFANRALHRLDRLDNISFLTTDESIYDGKVSAFTRFYLFRLFIDLFRSLTKF